MKGVKFFDKELAHVKSFMLPYCVIHSGEKIFLNKYSYPSRWAAWNGNSSCVPQHQFIIILLGQKGKLAVVMKKEDLFFAWGIWRAASASKPNIGSVDAWWLKAKGVFGSGQFTQIHIPKEQPYLQVKIGMLLEIGFHSIVWYCNRLSPNNPHVRGLQLLLALLHVCHIDP